MSICFLQFESLNIQEFRSYFCLHTPSISYSFWDILLQTFQGLTLTFDLQRSSEVKKIYSIWKPIHDFLSNFHWHFLSHTVFEIFDFKFFRVWPWPLTFNNHLRSNIFIPFESPYMTSYLTSIDTFSLSCTVFEIFDFKLFRVWPWPLTPKGHLRSKIFIPFESPCITSYLTSIDIFSLSRTVFEKMPIKILKATQNGGIWPFKGQGHKSIFFYYRKGTSSHQTASFEILHMKIGSAV